MFCSLDFCLETQECERGLQPQLSPAAFRFCKLTGREPRMLLNIIKATLKILSEKNKGSYGNTNSVALHISYLFLSYYFCPKGSFSLVALLNKHLNMKSEHWPPASTAAGTLCFLLPDILNKGNLQHARIFFSLAPCTHIPSFP